MESRGDDGAGQVEKEAAQNDRSIEPVGALPDAGVFNDGGQRQHRSQHDEGFIEPGRKKR